MFDDTVDKWAAIGMFLFFLVGLFAVGAGIHQLNDHAYEKCLADPQSAVDYGTKGIYRHCEGLDGWGGVFTGGLFLFIGGAYIITVTVAGIREAMRLRVRS